MKIPSVFLACLMAVSSLPAYIFAADTADRKPGTLAGATKRPISVYLAPLRAFDRKFSVIEEKLIAFDAKPRPATKADREKAMKELNTLGGDLTREGRGLGQMLAKMCDPNSTRWGLAEEAQLVTRIRESIERSAKIIQGHSGVKIAAAADEKEGEEKTEKRRSLLLKGADMLLHRKVDAFLTEQGLEALLQPEGVKEAGDIVIGQVRLSLKAVLDAQSREVLKMPLKDLRSLNAAFRLKVRQFIRKKTAKLVMNFTGNGLVISLAQRVVLKWLKTKVWPMLREAFRQKGDLENRVAVSIGTMKKSRDELNELSRTDPSKVGWRKVGRAIRRAKGRFTATRYLDKDLTRARRQDLIDKMDVARTGLAKVLRRVSFQFMIDEEDRQAAMVDEGIVIFGLLKTVKTTLERTGSRKNLAVRLLGPGKFKTSSVGLQLRLIRTLGTGDKMEQEPYAHDTVARVRFGRQVRYSHFVAPKPTKTRRRRIRRPPEYEARFCGLANGKHTVTGTLTSADGFIEDFTFEIEVKVPENYSKQVSKSLKELQKSRAIWAAADDNKKRLWAASHCVTIVTHARMLLLYRAAGPDQIHALLDECKGPAKLARENKGMMGQGLRSRYLRTLAGVLLGIGDERAYAAAKDCAAEIESISKRYASPVCGWVALLALTSGNKAVEGSGYERKKLTLAGGVVTKEDLSLSYFPKPIVVPASMIYYGEFETDDSPSAKPDGSTSRPAGLAPR